MSIFNFLKKYCYLFVLLFLVACNNSDCIEADDFGEYDTDIVEVFAKNNGCYWGGFSDEKNSSYMINCLNLGETTNSVGFASILSSLGSSSSCKASLGGDATCLNFASCKADASGSRDCFEGLLNNAGDCSASELDLLLEKSYEKCLDICIDKCATGVGYEPEWVGNMIKSDSSILGISLANGKSVEVQARGSIKLLNDETISNSYNGGGKKFESLEGFYSDPFYFTIDGKTGVPGSSTAVGETGGAAENTESRNEFLSRLFFKTRTVSNGVSLNASGNLDATNQALLYDKGFYNKFVWSSTENNIDFNFDSKFNDASDSDKETIKNMYLQNDFVKKNGGILIPKNIEKYVFDNPFQTGRLECDTDSTYNVFSCKYSSVFNLGSGGIVCSKADNSNSFSCYFEEGTSASNSPIEVLFSNGIFTSSFDIGGGVIATNAVVLGNITTKAATEVSVLFPVKVAVKNMNPGSTIDQSTDKCEISFFDGSSTLIEKIIPTTNIGSSWEYLNSSAKGGNNFILADYQKSPSFLETDTVNNIYKSELTVTDVKQYNISFSKECKHLGLFLIPQPEIRVAKSGFIEMRDFLNTNSAIKSIKFDIINSLYAVERSAANEALIKDNFYENKDFSNKITSVFNSWSNALNIFVRKGQTLRLNSDNWFTLPAKDIVLKTDFGTFLNPISYIGMYISERPALYCSDTNGSKNVLNPDCQLKTEYQTKTINELIDLNDKGTVTCEISYAKYCPLVVSGQPGYDRRCPYGCYKDNPKDCQATDASYGDKKSCDKCEEYLNTVKVDPVKLESYRPCYSLESYNGAFRNVNSSTDLLGTVKEVSNIFTDGSEGNLMGGVALDVSGTAGCSTVSSVRTCSKYLYNSINEFPVSGISQIDFLFINNNNFEFSNNNSGYFNISRNKDNLYKNGQQLSVILAHKKWAGKNVSGSDVCGQLVMYSGDKFALVYPTNDNDERYGFNNAGYMTKLTTNDFSANGSYSYTVAKTKSCTYESKDVAYEDMRFFFKIIDLDEDGCGSGNTSEYTPMCRYKYGNTIDTSIAAFECNKSNPPLTKKCYGGDKCTSQTCSDKDTKGNDISTKSDKCDYYPLTVVENEKKCVNKYKNNSGSYSIRLKAKKDSKLSGYIVDYIMRPILEVLDGKTIAIEMDNTKKLIECDTTTNNIVNSVVANPRCIWYDSNDLSNTKFGNACNKGDINCYNSCFSSDSNVEFFRTNCLVINDGQGFLNKFYHSIISSPDYKAIVTICFTLMIAFYGMYYLMGLADLTHAELIKRVFKIGFVYLLIGEQGWTYYNAFFVKFFKGGVDYLVFAMAGAFDSSSSLNAAFANSNFYDKSVLFSGVDRNLALMFSDQVSYKIWGLFFVSFFGWLYVFLIYSSILTYIFAIAQSMLIYLTAQFFISFLLAFGPIFFILLIFEKTKGMFDKWINNLISFSLEQIFLLTCLGIFNMLIYNIIKFVLSYRVCWAPVWVIDLPVLGRFQLMSFWKATSETSPEAAASAIPGLFQILIIYLIADLMKNFIIFATDLGSSLGGGGITSSFMSENIAKTAKDVYAKKIEAPVKDMSKKMGLAVANKTIGYRSEEQIKGEKDDNKAIREGIRSAKRSGDEAVKKEKKKLLSDADFMGKSKEEQNLHFANVAEKAMKASIDGNKNMLAAAERQGVSKEKLYTEKAGKFQGTATSVFGFVGNRISSRGITHKNRSAQAKTESVMAGTSKSTKVGFFDKRDAEKMQADEVYKERAALVKEQKELKKDGKTLDEDKQARLDLIDKKRGNFAQRWLNPLRKSGYRKVAAKDLKAASNEGKENKSTYKLSDEDKEKLDSQIKTNAKAYRDEHGKGLDGPAWLDSPEQKEQRKAVEHGLRAVEAKTRADFMKDKREAPAKAVAKADEESKAKAAQMEKDAQASREAREAREEQRRREIELAEKITKAAGVDKRVGTTFLNETENETRRQREEKKVDNSKEDEAIGGDISKMFGDAEKIAERADRKANAGKEDEDLSGALNDMFNPNEDAPE